MVSVTLSIPKKIKAEMDKHVDINWSGFIRQQIIKKVEQLAWKEEMLRRYEWEQNEGISQWVAELKRKASPVEEKR